MVRSAEDQLERKIFSEEKRPSKNSSRYLAPKVLLGHLGRSENYSESALDHLGRGENRSDCALEHLGRGRTSSLGRLG